MTLCRSLVPPSMLQRGDLFGDWRCSLLAGHVGRHKAFPYDELDKTPEYVWGMPTDTELTIMRIELLEIADSLITEGCD